MDFRRFNSLVSMMEYFTSDQQCRKYLVESRWGDDVVCPYCGCHHCKVGYRGRYVCPGCLNKFSCTVGTIFENTKVSLRKWFIAIYLISYHKKGISSCQLAKDIQVTQKTAWYMLQKIRCLFYQGDHQLEGEIELDEVYVPLSTGSEKAADIPDTANAGIMELPVIRCTCYCTGTITATGKRVREGMISSSREHFGQSANLYTESGELIGTFVCEDTGGKPIKQGKVLDVYRNDIDGVHRWQKEYGDYIRIEWIERDENGNKEESK